MGRAVNPETYLRKVPDNFDYEQLAQLLSSPRDWTPEDLSVVEFLLEQQRDAVASRHPRDRWRDPMQRLVEQLEAALGEYRASH